MTDEDELQALDAMPEEDWLVPPWYQIQPRDRLNPHEMELIQDIIGRRAPQLLPQLDSLGKSVQRPSQRKRLRLAILDELLEFGTNRDSDFNEYGNRVDDLMRKLGEI